MVQPDWPAARVLLSKEVTPWTGTLWWHIFHAGVTPLRAAGFSPSGASLVAATNSDVTLWTRA